MSETFKERSARYDSLGLGTPAERAAMHAHETRGIPFNEALERYTKAHEVMAAIRSAPPNPELLAAARTIIDNFNSPPNFSGE